MTAQRANDALINRANHGSSLGARPEPLGLHSLGEGVGLDPKMERLPEYMHFLYLPVWTPEVAALGDSPFDHKYVPANLLGVRRMLETVYRSEHFRDGDYVYVNAQRGYVPQGHHQNRPGWHADGYGSDDHSFVWFNCVPTLWADQDFQDIPADHGESIAAMTRQIDVRRIRKMQPFVLYGLSTSVVHCTSGPGWGADRSFVKITISSSRYNLEGNSHNHLMDYSWDMHDRDVVRNHPTASESNSVP